MSTGYREYPPPPELAAAVACTWENAGTGDRARPVVPDGCVDLISSSATARDATVWRLAADLGVSERQLHRRVSAAVGYGPKMLARVARLRRLAVLADEPLAARAFAAGYASQAHMSDEVRRLTGRAAVRFLEDASLTAA